VQVHIRTLQWPEGLRDLSTVKNKHFRRTLLMKRLAAHKDRTKDIVKQIVEAAIDNNRYVLVLSRLVNHLEAIMALLPPNTNAGLLIGSKSKPERKRVLNECRVILATDRLAKEGLDHSKLNTLIFAMPLSGVQFYGRITRKDSGALMQSGEKTPLIIDYNDVGYDANSSRHLYQRIALYKKYGFTITQYRL
jgi:superfamily II DNA or RNA helicase